jgi:hypothetical protein
MTPMMKEHGRFQLEATKLGRTVVLQVTVFERTDRDRTRLFAETQCSDPMHFIVQFIVKDAPDFDSLLSRFLEELAHRGFTATRYRRRGEGVWADWIPLAPLPLGTAG